MLRRSLALLLFLATAPSQAAPPPLGRLFFDPPQRAKLDLQRQRNPGFIQEAAENDASLTINGEVRSSNGRRIRWINGAANWDNTAPAPRIPVGDTYLPGSGEHQSVLGNGRITIKPAPRTP
ncbi:MAG: hypothetical protein H6R13_2753 [Proteobacteria bacterium]|nr:hypothetical protein [Pseudomonadota bacterium]